MKFKSIYVNVNSSLGSIGRMDKMEHYAYMTYGEIGKESPLYAENLISGRSDRQISLEDLPDNLRVLRKLAIELASKFSAEEFTYRYNELKGIFEITYSNAEFGNVDRVRVFISEAALLINDELKEQITHLTDPQNTLITKIMNELNEDYILFKKTNKDDRNIYHFDKIEPFYLLSVELFNAGQLGDQRIKNLLNNRLYSKYLITEPLK